MPLVTLSVLLSNEDLPESNKGHRILFRSSPFNDFVTAAEGSFLGVVLNLSPRSLVAVPLFF